MAHLKETIIIQSSREKIWSLLTTPDSILKWFVGLDTLSATPNYPAVGSSLAGAYKVLAVELKSTQTVTAANPGHEIHYSMEGIVNGTQDWVITETAGGLQLEMTMNYNMGLGILGKVAEPAVHQMNITNAQKSLQNVKAMAEA